MQFTDLEGQGISGANASGDVYSIMFGQFSNY